MRGFDARKLSQHRLEPLGARVVHRQIAGLTGAEIHVAVVIGEGGGAPVRIDHRDQLPAETRIKEPPHLQELDLGERQALHAPRREFV